MSAAVESGPVPEDHPVVEQLGEEEEEGENEGGRHHYQIHYDKRLNKAGDSHLVLDAERVGNVTRFINNAEAADANLRTVDVHLPVRPSGGHTLSHYLNTKHTFVVLNSQKSYWMFPRRVYSTNVRNMFARS